MTSCLGTFSTARESHENICLHSKKHDVRGVQVRKKKERKNGWEKTKRKKEKKRKIDKMLVQRNLIRYEKGPLDKIVTHEPVGFALATLCWWRCVWDASRVRQFVLFLNIWQKKKIEKKQERSVDIVLDQISTVASTLLSFEVAVMWASKWTSEPPRMHIFTY